MKSNGNGRDRSGEVHIVTGSKGGIGKSAIAGFLAQYLGRNGEEVLCFDVDAANPTLSAIKSLKAVSVPLLVNGVVSPRMFDAMMETIAANAGPFVIDVGSSVYFPFWKYVVANKIFELLANIEPSPRRAVIHVPLAGGSSTDETLKAFGEICRVAPSRSVVAWLNQRPESVVELDGHDFSDLPVATIQEEKLFGVLVTTEQLYELHSQQISEMLKDGMTFDEATTAYGLIRGPRIRIVRDELYSKLSQIGV